ncbi:hypothetical protein, partial [Salmonella sp. s57610]|uniref:hypothetical protein n=1 Tax=Salmonella sp. s57610 TaxID=3159697 RepID=UPI00397F705F
MQKELLQQIAERKKLVSSIKNSVIDPDSNEFLNKDGNISSPSDDTPSDGNEDINEDTKSSPSVHRNSNSTVDDSLKS